MGRPDEAVKHLQQGMSLGKIAESMHISILSVGGYLYKKVGEGAIRRSDMLFAIPKETRDLIEGSLKNPGIRSAIGVYYDADRKGHKLDQQEIGIYMTLRDARISMGDMYEFITEIETTLHKMIKGILQREYGTHERGWWRQGIPEQIRKACVIAREEDPEPVEEDYCYTTFIQMKQILEKQWTLFCNRLPKSVVKDKKELLNCLGRLNHIRNCVMHPVKGLRITEDDFQFVRKFNAKIQESKWRP